MPKKSSRQKSRPIDKFLFDDCPICQAMKKADQQGRNLTEPELKAAFKEARDQGATVGGEWLDEKGTMTLDGSLFKYEMRRN